MPKNITHALEIGLNWVKFNYFLFYDFTFFYFIELLFEFFGEISMKDEQKLKIT